MKDKPVGFYVMDKPCDECLFGKNKLVSDRGKKQILSKCQRESIHFECHKATNEDKHACCRGFWNANVDGDIGTIQVAQRLASIGIGEIVFVSEDDLK